jgi:Fur family ferric uptake transcriptional regulator
MVSTGSTGGGKGSTGRGEGSTGGDAGEAWQERLRASGHRLTPQRELVLAAVEDLGHATPDEVYAEVRTHSESINLSTVYRTLELLDELGLIRHAHLTDRAPTYHSARGHEHAHFVCRNCRTVISIGLSEVASALGDLANQHGFTPDYGHLTVFGWCADCEPPAGVTAGHAEH